MTICTNTLRIGQINARFNTRTVLTARTSGWAVTIMSPTVSFPTYWLFHWHSLAGNAIRWSIGAYMNEIKECGLPSTTFDSSIDWHCVGHAMQVGTYLYTLHKCIRKLEYNSFLLIIIDTTQIVWHLGDLGKIRDAQCWLRCKTLPTHDNYCLWIRRVSALFLITKI